MLSLLLRPNPGLCENPLLLLVLLAALLSVLLRQELIQDRRGTFLTLLRTPLRSLDVSLLLLGGLSLCSEGGLMLLKACTMSLYSWASGVLLSCLLRPLRECLKDTSFHQRLTGCTARSRRLVERPLVLITAGGTAVV